MNKVNESSKKIEANVWWRVAYKCVIYGAAVLTVVFILGYIMAVLNKKKGDVTHE
jgi:heme/copper-type cytochrome/quinol oxidase subunit 2